MSGVDEAVPVAHRESQVLGHRLVTDFLAGVVVLERQRIVGVAAFIGDSADAGEVFALADKWIIHGVEPYYWMVEEGSGPQAVQRIVSLRIVSRRIV